MGFKNQRITLTPLARYHPITPFVAGYTPDFHGFPKDFHRFSKAILNVTRLHVEFGQDTAGRFRYCSSTWPH